MLKVPLDSVRHRKLSISSAEEESFDQLKLMAVIDEQKRNIRKLKLKVSKLEEVIEKQREDSSKSKEDDSPQTLNNPHLEMLKAQIEKSDILEETVNKIAAKINEITLEILPQAHDWMAMTTNFLHSTKNYESPDHNPENHKHPKPDFETFIAINRCFDQLNLLQRTYIRFRDLIIHLKLQNNHIKGSLLKSADLSKRAALEIEELKQIKLQFESQRKHCIKLKKLLEKSQYQRNRMMVTIDQMTLNNQENTMPNHQQLLKLSKSLTYKINTLEKEKSEIIRQNLKEKQSWAKKYKQFLRVLKQFKRHRQI